MDSRYRQPGVWPHCTRRAEITRGRSKHESSGQENRFPPNVALTTTYLNDVRFDLSRGQEGTAFITDSTSSGPNGIIVVDFDNSRRRLHDHPSTKPDPEFVPVVESEILQSELSAELNATLSQIAGQMERSAEQRNPAPAKVSTTRWRKGRTMRSAVDMRTSPSPWECRRPGPMRSPGQEVTPTRMRFKATDSRMVSTFPKPFCRVSTCVPGLSSRWALVSAARG